MVKLIPWARIGGTHVAKKRRQSAVVARKAPSNIAEGKGSRKPRGGRSTTGESTDQGQTVSSTSARGRPAPPSRRFRGSASATRPMPLTGGADRPTVQGPFATATKLHRTAQRLLGTVPADGDKLAPNLAGTWTPGHHIAPLRLIHARNAGAAARAGRRYQTVRSRLAEFFLLVIAPGDRLPKGGSSPAVSAVREVFREGFPSKDDSNVPANPVASGVVNGVTPFAFGTGRFFTRESPTLPPLREVEKMARGRICNFPVGVAAENAACRAATPDVQPTNVAFGIEGEADSYVHCFRAAGADASFRLRLFPIFGAVGDQMLFPAGDACALGRSLRIIGIEVESRGAATAGRGAELGGRIAFGGVFGEIFSDVVGGCSLPPLTSPIDRQDSLP